MNRQLASMFFLLLFMIFWKNVAFASDCSDAMLGDYARKPDGAAIFRIEKINNIIVSRSMTEDGRWDSLFQKADLMTEKKLLEMVHQDDHTAKKSCGMDVPGFGMLLKVPPGFNYAVSSSSGQFYDVKRVESGYLLQIMQSFSSAGMDLYRVPHLGESPPPVPKGKASHGHEVPLAAVCPGGRLPDTRQENFDALPSDYRTWFHRLSARQQMGFVCGTFFSYVMGNKKLGHDEFDDAAVAPNIGGKLQQVTLLLDSKQVPRNAAGQQTWWASTAQLLIHSHEGDSSSALLENGYAELFEQKILLHLLALDDTGKDDTEKSDVMKQIFSMPEPIGLRVLEKLNTSGLLRSTQGSLSSLQRKMLSGATRGRSQAMFDTLMTALGPDVFHNGNSIFIEVINGKNIAGVQRLLKAGFNPAHSGLLRLARYHDSKEIYPLLLKAVLDQARKNGSPAGTSKLPPGEAELIFEDILKSGDRTVDWKEVDFLLSEGVNVNDFGKFNSNPLSFFALRSPEVFKGFLKRGLRMDVEYPWGEYSKRIGEKSNVPLAMYLLTSDRANQHRADVVAAMLASHNNANGPLKCKPCDNFPLVLGIRRGDPEIVRTMLDFGADPNRQNSNKDPVFVKAVVSNKTELLDVMESKVKLNINALNNDGVSPLAWAQCTGAKDAIVWLEQRHAVSSGKNICAEIMRKRELVKEE